MGTHGSAGTRSPGLPVGNRSLESADADSAPRRRRRRGLSNWPVSRKLFAVIIAAVLMGVIFGGLRVADAESSATQFSRVSQLANLGEQLTPMIYDLENERDATLGRLVNASADNALTTLQNKTSADAAGVTQAAAAIGRGFPPNIQADASKVAADTSPTSIGVLHATVSTYQDEAATFGDFNAAIDDMITLASQVSQGAADAALTSDVQALNGLAQAEEQASEQRGQLNYDFAALPPVQPSPFFDPSLGRIDPKTNMPVGEETTGQFFDDSAVQALSVVYAQEFVDEAAFHSSATTAETAFFSAAFGGSGMTTVHGVSLVENYEQNIFRNNDAVPASSSPTAPSVPGSPALFSGTGLTAPNGTVITTLPQLRKAWAAGTTDKLNAMEATEQFMAANVAARAGQLHNSARQTALLFGVITLVVLLIVLLAALLVARSLVLPLRRLRAGALNIASVQLPERVRMLSDSPETAASMAVAPINVTSQDEIGQVARAFDQVHAEAVRLAGEQALLRSSFNAMFVNLSRRSQSLIERLARTIDTLEQTEDDPDRLGSLFTMDHMVTRMRRNSENLLLLAGHENPRKWSDAIPLADVARAATSEIEQYNRVLLNIPPGIAVIGPAVSDIVHLIAELVENATIFSPKDTQVQLSVQELSSGGVLIEILDKGIGVSEARLTDMNFRLDNPPTIDVSVSRHMGLFAVARLAERHRVRVRLRPAAPQGLSALVWLPDSVIERTGRYSPVQSWSTQTTGSPVSAGARPGMAPGMGPDLAIDDGNVALAQNGYAGVGYGGNSGSGSGNAYGGNGNAYGGNGNAYGGNGGNGSTANGGNANGADAPTAREAREARTASGWFRGPMASGPGPAAPAGGGAVPFAGADTAPGTPADRSVRRIPGGSLAGSGFADQTSAGLPVRSPRGSQTPAAAAGAGLGAEAGPGAQIGTGAQALPVRGNDPGRAAASRGPVPRGPGGGSHALPQRSPDQARSRLAGFQRGNRRAEEQPGQTGQFDQVPGAGEGSER